MQAENAVRAQSDAATGAVGADVREIFFEDQMGR
jgi:hypothetical protein